MLKKLLILFLVGNLLNIVSCCRCHNVDPKSMVFTQVLLDNLKVSYDNDLISTTLSDDSLIDVYGVEINFSHNIIACKNAKPIFQFINSAYACECEELQYILTNKVKKIDIITLRDFDSTHLANTNITDYFFSYSGQTQSGEHYKRITVNEAIKNGPFLLSYNAYMTHVYAILDKQHKPTIDQHIQFEVLVTMDDLSVLSAKTKTIKLKV